MSRLYLVAPVPPAMPKKQKFPYLVGSKWTSQQQMFGWRHFQVVNRKNQGKWVFAEMVAACDPDARFWINRLLAKVLVRVGQVGKREEQL